MNLVEAQTHLLSNRELLERFARDPEGVARELRIAESERPAFQSLSAGQLNRQADGLRRKRLHEVGKLLPRTRRELGADFEAAFLRYADTNWPEGHRRHWLDASGFLDSLGGCRHSAVCGIEERRARFFASRRRFVLALSFLGESLISITVFFRCRDEPHEWALRFGERKQSNPTEAPLARPITKP